jgi:dephospho-CoA kinase
MIIVGLTGGIGSGKTTVAQMFNKLGVPVYIADLEAKRIMQTSESVKKRLIDLFGSKAYIDGKLNRLFIADKIFHNKCLLQDMNNVVHPMVGIHFKAWLEKQKSPYIIKEAAILFENDSYKSCDLMILVTAPKKTRISRVKKRDNTSEDKIRAIMNNQWPDEQKIELSHFVIRNEDLLDTESQVERIHKDILNRITKG